MLTITNEERFVKNKEGQIIDREMHPKVLKAQKEAQKQGDKAKRRVEQQQRQ